jgi:predicted DNA-binding transcriptional regulator AlpA
MVPKFLRQPQVAELMGARDTWISTAVKDGLLTPPVQLSARHNVWPQHEIGIINAARISSKSPDEIRELVKQLVAERAKILPACLAAHSRSIQESATA